MKKAVLFVDGPNVNASTLAIHGPNARLDFRRFCARYESDGMFLTYKAIAASDTYTNGGFWDAMARLGFDTLRCSRKYDAQTGQHREGAVDTSLAIAAAQAIALHEPDLVVLLSGDQDMSPIAGLAKAAGAQVHIWASRASMSQNLAASADTAYYMEDYPNLFFEEAQRDEVVVPEEKENCKPKPHQDEQPVKDGFTGWQWVGIGVFGVVCFVGGLIFGLDA